MRAADLDVERLGDGPPVVLVHGSIVDARRTWRHQRVLAEDWTLIMPNRPGFAASPALERGDFEVEAPLLADLLPESGAHLVGHSYGGVIALLIAALVPGRVWSLTVSEPGALRLAAGRPDVDATIAHGEQLFGLGDQVPLSEFVRLFREGVGSTHETPDELPDWLARGAALVRAERPIWHVDPPLDALAAAPFDTLVISGGHSTVFDAVCDVLCERIGAQRAVVAGRGHTIPATGQAYNDCLTGFIGPRTPRPVAR